MTYKIATLSAFISLVMPMQLMANQPSSADALKAASTVLVLDRICDDISMDDAHYYAWQNLQDLMSAQFAVQSIYQPIIDDGAAQARSMVQELGCQTAARTLTRTIGVSGLYIYGGN